MYCVHVTLEVAEVKSVDRGFVCELRRQLLHSIMRVKDVNWWKEARRRLSCMWGTFLRIFLVSPLSGLAPSSSSSSSPGTP